MRDDVEHLAEHLLHLMNIRQLTLITAESRTAGALSERLADAPGAGLRFHGGFVACTKAQKNCALGVSWDLLREKGAISGAVAPDVARDRRSLPGLEDRKSLTTESWDRAVACRPKARPLGAAFRNGQSA